MQEHALAVGALLVAEPGRAVLSCTELCLQNPVAVLRPVHCLDAAGGILFLLKRDIYAK